jgi:hypothetical protein
MIRLKKKAEEKAASTSMDESMATASTSVAGTSMEIDESSSSAAAATSSSATAAEAAQFKLLGIGGKTIHAGEVKSTTKKKTPGEIRIQKGMCHRSLHLSPGQHPGRRKLALK